MRAADVVAVLDGQLVRVVGDPQREITRAASLDQADTGSITFCRAAGAEGRREIEASRAGVVVCREVDGADELAETRTLLIVDEPRLAFVRVLDRLFAPSPEVRGIHPTAFVAPGAHLADDVAVGAFTYIGDVEVGPGSILHPHVTVHSGVRLGRNVVVRAGSVIGVEGFGYQRNEGGALERFPHLGGVVIGDDVEFGSNVVVQRGALGDTVVGRGTKIDSFVHVGHNVVIGEDAVVTAHAMLGGSARIGDRAWIAPCACIRDDGIEIGADAVVGLGAVVTKDVPAGTTVMGAPAREAAEFKRLLEKMKSLEP